MRELSYFIRSRGRISGPYGTSVIHRMLRRGRASRFDEASTDRANWMTLDALLRPEPAGAQQSARGTEGASPVVERFFYSSNGNTVGPVPLQLLVKLAENGRIDADTMVWRQGQQLAVPAATLRELGRLFSQASSGPRVTVSRRRDG